MDLAKELVEAEGSSLLLHDAETGGLVFHVVSGEKNEIIKGEIIPKGEGIAGNIAESGKPLIVNDVTSDPRHFKETDKRSSFVTRNVLGVPIEIKGKIMGVLEVVNACGRDGFDNWDKKLLCFLADQAAIAISNRRLYDEVSDRVKELTTLFEISQSISTAAPNENKYNIILDSIARSLDVNKASLILYDRTAQKYVITAAIGHPDLTNLKKEIDLPDSITGYVLRNGTPLLITDINKHPEFTFNNSITYKTNSFLSTPIRLENEVIGVLNLTDKMNQSSFNTFDFGVTSTITIQIAGIYQNQMFQEKIQEQKRLTQEINIASQIHRKILPVIPENIGNHLLAAYNKPAKEMGGDFYDFFIFDDEKYAVLVADVSGKGIPAALFMGSSRNIIRAEARINNQPARLLSTANKYIYEDSESGMFVTLFYMLVDMHNNLITYGSAGHNNQILVKSKTKEVIRLNAKGRALGLQDNSKFEEKVIIFEPDDIVLLFTDGVLEYLGNGDIDIGEEKLIETVTNNNYTPTELVAYYTNHLEENHIEEEFIDDFTYFSIKL